MNDGGMIQVKPHTRIGRGGLTDIGSKLLHMIGTATDEALDLLVIACPKSG